MPPLSRTQRLVIALATSGAICATGYWSAPSIIRSGSAFSRTILKVTFLPISLASEFNFFGSISVMLAFVHFGICSSSYSRLFVYHFSSSGA